MMEFSPGTHGVFSGIFGAKWDPFTENVEPETSLQEDVGGSSEDL